MRIKAYRPKFFERPEIAKLWRPLWPSSWLNFASLQIRLIIPYVLLTLLMASIGTYIVTRLVAVSIGERFINQLGEASRVTADGIVRHERTQLETLRLMAFTNGVSDALANHDADTLQKLLAPLALNNNVEVLTLFDTAGHEVLSLVRNQAMSQGTDLSQVDLVAKVLVSDQDDLGDKFSGLLDLGHGVHLFTVAPIRNAAGELVGGVMIGTRLVTLLGELKAQALADIIVLDLNGEFLATTFAAPDESHQVFELDASALAELASTPIRDISLYKRDFQIAYSPLVVRQQTMGVLGVALPNDYVTATVATSRNTFSLIFTLGTAAVILVGYFLSQSIAHPVLRLRTMAQSVAAGDLTQSSKLTAETNEIGELAQAFDVMTMRLRERTEESKRLYAEALQINRDLAEVNAQLQATQKQLIQSEKLAAIGQLTAGIVHDVRNPLMIIKAVAELLQGEFAETSDIWEQLEIIQTSATRANTIVSDLLTFARQSTPTLACRDLRETVEAAVRLTNYLTLAAHIEVCTHLPPTAVRAVYDPQQIEQVLINLIQNAIHAMPQKGQLKLSLRQMDEAVVISVQDNGRGISPENLARIFEPFFTTKPEEEGTGLGLSVSYGIVANHGGRLDVESVVNQGTTFTVWLPLGGPLSTASTKELTYVH